MRVGYFTMPLHPPGADPGRTMADDLEQLVFLDQLGYEEAWIGEHITAEWENIPCPDLFIAQALAMTRRMKLGTGVSCLPNHNPLMLAQRIAQLDQMARGRFLWGVGSGGFPGDLELFELDARRRHRAVSRAMLDLVLDLWNDPSPGSTRRRAGGSAFPSRRTTSRSVFMAVPAAASADRVAGVTAKSEMFALAGERGWIPMSLNLVPPRVLKTHWASVEAGARRAGGVRRPQDLAHRRDVFIADTTAEARRQALHGNMGRDWTGSTSSRSSARGAGSTS